MLKRVLLLTGSPGVGKTTVITEAVQALAEEGIRVGGMISQEVRANGERIGFRITDLGSKKIGWLAQVNQKRGPRLGKYSVNLKDLEEIGAAAIVEAVKNCDLVVIDEIGPMELFSSKFGEAAEAALKSPKPVIGVVHAKAVDRIATDIRNRQDSEVLTVTEENRKQLSKLITLRAMEYLREN